MAENYKVLGQVAPSATTVTTLYTCPALTQTVVSTISVCNRGSVEQTFRIAIRPNGESLANKHYIAYDGAIASKDSLFLSVGATVDASDIIEVYASSGDLSFNLFGSEIV